MEGIINNIDFEKLKKQKNTLLQVMNVTGKEQTEDLQGILNLIDSIQDHAVDVMGKDENEVFDLGGE